MDNSTATTVTVDPRHISYTHIIYALHALSILMGIGGARYIVTAFVFGVPSIVALIMNYARRDLIRGTWLESHFRWQMRTFWIAFIAYFVIRIAIWPFALVGMAAPFLWLGYGLLGAWAIYRVARGWLALKEGRSLPIGGF